MNKRIVETLLFHWGLEGGGSKVFRITENGKERIVQRYNYMDIDENDDEIWRQGEIKHPSFEAFWKKAVKDKKWFWWHSVFIHDDCKPIIRKSFEKIDLSKISESNQMSIDEWLKKLDIQDEVCEYQEGNEWQKNRYAYMSEYNRKARIKEFGTAKGGKKRYFHILKRTDKNILHNFLNEQEILDEVNARFSVHKGGDFERLLTNTVASQPCCFNLFAPLKKRPVLASKLFSQIMGKEVQVQHIEIEFTPYVEEKDVRHLNSFPFNVNESLGDQSTFGGTDADVAVFYTFGEQKRGVILIEFKYIESKFSVCGSYREKNGNGKDRIAKKNIRPVCDSPEFYEKHILPFLDKSDKPLSPACGYLKYNNWQLLEESKVFDISSIKTAGKCPFRYSLQQLWRNLLLAENVYRVRKLDEFQFWVLCPSQNKSLWQEKVGVDVETEFRKILTPLGNSIFSRKDLKADFVDNLKLITRIEWEREWIGKFEERYLTLSCTFEQSSSNS